MRFSMELTKLLADIHSAHKKQFFESLAVNCQN
jgi:hypothetical protein